MYSPIIIERRLEDFAAREGWMPVRHSIAEVEEFKKYINSIIKIDSNSKNSYVELKTSISDKRAKEVRRWIENEQVLCSLDSEYFESRYAYVCDEEGQIIKFESRLSQRIYTSVLADFDEKQFPIQILCLDPDTKVLTADLRWVRLDDIKVGDELVAVDEGQTLEDQKKQAAERYQERRKGIYREKPKKHVNKERKMATCVVEEKWDTFSESMEIIFEDGRKIISSPDHKFLSKRRGGVEPVWYDARTLEVGSEIRSITTPWEESSYEDGWFGGFIDGEGSFSYKSEPGADICVCQRDNVALARAREYLEANSYSYREEVDRRDPSTSSKFGKDPVYRLHVSRSDEVFKLIGKTRPSRFIEKRWWEGKCLPGKRGGGKFTWAKIVSINLMEQQRLVDIQTSTGTFIAEGLVTHNCLKGRQLGITTQTALKFIHRMMFVPHTQAIMASVKASASELIERILTTAYNNSPWWLVPHRMPKGAFANGSILSIQSGMQATGIAQGWTPTMAHLSELADIPNPKRTIEEGLFRAMHPSKNLFMVLEGTGGGSTGWLADTWRSAKTGDHRLKGIFIPWACCPEIYPKKDFIRERPVPGNFTATRSDACRKHVARAESYIRNTPYLSRVMGVNYTMPVEQQWFWEFNYRAACQNHTQKTWLAQMPCDDFESLTGKHDSVFDPEIIDEVENHVYEVRTDYTTGAVEKQRKNPIRTYAITGHDVDEVFYPEESAIDYDSPMVRVTWNSHRGQRYEWDMIPLLALSEDTEANTMDRLIVYEEPKSGSYYSCGIDTADGLGKEDEDRTVLSGTKNRYNDEYDEQVFELTSNRINSAQIVAFAACVGAWYGPMCPDSRGIKYAVEQIRGPGDTCQHQLKMMGFNNHHKPRRYDGKAVKEKPGNKEGWYSNSWSVPMLMTRFIEAVTGGWYQPQSKWLIEECKTLERHEREGKSKMEHRSGQHDDRVRAAAQSYFTRHDDDVLAERAQKRYSGAVAQQLQKKRQQKNGGRIGLISVGEGWN